MKINEQYPTPNPSDNNDVCGSSGPNISVLEERVSEHDFLLQTLRTQITDAEKRSDGLRQALEHSFAEHLRTQKLLEGIIAEWRASSERWFRFSLIGGLALLIIPEALRYFVK